MTNAPGYLAHRWQTGMPRKGEPARENTARPMLLYSQLRHPCEPPDRALVWVRSDQFYREVRGTCGTPD